jgi:hypothetical protein
MGGEELAEMVEVARGGADELAYRPAPLRWRFAPGKENGDREPAKKGAPRPSTTGRK